MPKYWLKNVICCSAALSANAVSACLSGVEQMRIGTPSAPPSRHTKSPTSMRHQIGGHLRRGRERHGVRARVGAGRVRHLAAVRQRRVGGGDGERDVEGGLVGRLVERGERAPRVGGLHLRHGVFPAVGRAQVEAAQLVVENAGVGDGDRRRAGGQRPVHGEASRFRSSRPRSRAPRCVWPPAVIETSPKVISAACSVIVGRRLLDASRGSSRGRGTWPCRGRARTTACSARASRRRAVAARMAGDASRSAARDEKKSAHEKNDSRVFSAVPCWDERWDDLRRAAESGFIEEGEAQDWRGPADALGWPLARQCSVTGRGGNVMKRMVLTGLVAVFCAACGGSTPATSDSPGPADEAGAPAAEAPPPVRWCARSRFPTAPSLRLDLVDAARLRHQPRRGRGARDAARSRHRERRDRPARGHASSPATSPTSKGRAA